MARKPDPYLIDEDAPELTDEELAAARPASQAMPAEIYAGLIKRRRGERGPGRKPAKVQVTVRLDPHAVEAWRQSGPGWQGRLNALVVREAPKTPKKRA